MKITKTQLSQIIKEELKATLNEGLPPAYVQGREDAYDQNAWVNHLKNGGDAEPNLPDDSLYMKGWNEAIEEMRMEAGDYDDREFGGDPNSFGDANDGYNYDDMYENKITKAQLSQIVKEELNNAMQEGIPSQGDYELGRQHALAVSQGEMAKEDTYLKRLRDKDYERGFDEQTRKLKSRDDEGGSDTDDSLNPDEPEGGLDDGWMWENKITKSQLAQLVQEELKATLSEYSDTEYDPYWDEKAEEDARDEALWSAIDELLVDLEDTPVPIRELIPPAPEGVTDIDWNEAGEEYLLGLVEAGDVVRVEGSPNDDWNGEEAELYVLAPR